MSLHVISHLDRSLLIMDCLAQLTCSGCEGMNLILSISFATDISHLARTGNIDSSRLIEVVHVHLGSPNINRIP